MKGILFLSFNFCLILLQFSCINSGNTQQNITQIKTQDSLILMQNLQDLACNKLVEYDKLTGLPEDKLTAVSGELCSNSIMIALEKFEIAKGEDDLVRRRSFILKNILKRVLDSCGKIDVQWRKECLSNFEPIYSKVMSNLNITVANNYQPIGIQTKAFGVGIENLKMRYTILGIEDAVIIEQNETTYSTTIKLF